MKEELEKLRIGRTKLETLQEELKQARILFDEENADLLETIKHVQEENLYIDLNIRNTAVEIFIETGNKKLDYGVGIKETTKYNYDLEIALGWAMEHSICLKLDEKAFKKMQSVKKCGFVQEVKEVTATIPKKIKVE